MNGDENLHLAALAFENAIRTGITFPDGETWEFRKVLDFGTVTATCVNGEATLWVVFPDKRAVHFKLVKSGKPLRWIYHERPKIIHTTFELFQGLSMWWGAVQWLEGMKDKEAAK